MPSSKTTTTAKRPYSEARSTQTRRRDSLAQYLHSRSRGDEANEILRKHAGAGFKSYFSGKDFEGWAGPAENYEIKDGAIVCKPGKGGTIYTKEEFSDFSAQ